MGRGERPIKLRNSSYSPKCIEVQRRGWSQAQVELPIGLGGVTAYRIQTNSEWRLDIHGSEAWGAKVPGREGKNPDHPLRSLNPG